MSYSALSLHRIHRAFALVVVTALVFCTATGELLAQAPPGYYDTVDTSNAAGLRSTLHAVIDDHTRFPYTSTATDTWNVLEQADEDPNDSGSILDVYKNASYAKEGGGNSFYNREHTWPKSYGFPNDGSTNQPYTDCHMLFLCDSGYNSSRSNKPYRTCSAACSEKVTDINDGDGGGSGSYPGNSSWTEGSLTAGTWETWVGRRGDVARALLYADVRYEGGNHGVTGISEPDLILTDIEALIDSSNTGSNESVAYMGMLSVLITWHQQDPVDAREIARNNAVFGFQGNRNPFIDNPAWVDCLFSGTCGGGGDTTPPLFPTGLAAVGGDGSVDLNWDDNIESDLAGYNVYRSLDGSSFTLLNGGLVPASTYTDSSVTNGTTYWYEVTAVDTSSNESTMSAMVFATPQGGGGSGGGSPWINEFHYDNASTDVGEFVEVAGPAGTDLSGWSLLGYNGNGGTVYKTVNLSGSLPDQQAGSGTLAFAFSSMQNGAPDGLALVDDTGAVIEFISYEGTFAAVGGAADGMTSVNVGVSETSSTPAGYSLQLTGTGSASADFTWAAASADTSGAVNTAQTFTGGGGGDTTPPSAPLGLLAGGGEGVVNLDWLDNTEPDLAGYDVFRSTSPGGPYAVINGAPVMVSSYDDSAVSNGTTYYYVVTASDDTGNESAQSNESSATPTDMTAPGAPTALGATGGDGSVSLDWADNGEGDLAGYDVLRSTSSGGPYSAVNGTLVSASAYNDTSATNGTTYFYVVRAEDDAGNQSAVSGEASATPQAAMPPAANFSGTPTSGTSPLNVNFTDLSTNTPTSWSWDFGDGNGSGSQNPSHTYTSAGSYTVSLMVTNLDGSDTLVRSAYINVSAPPTPPVADFSGTPTSGTSPLTVTFTDSSTNVPTSWAWDFGDGGTSTSQNPAYTYMSAGTYTVSLTVTNADGSDGLVRTSYIVVSDPPSGSSLLYMSFVSTTTVPGVGSVRDEDVVSYDPATDTWALYFDGSDVDVGGTDINALHVRDNGDILMSFTASTEISGLLGGPDGDKVDDSDVVLFTMTSSGSSTAGSFSFFLDGSDVSLSSNGEDIDGLHEFANGDIALSTVGSATASGLSQTRDEDVILFTPTSLGSSTAGSFVLHFDGSDVGFSESSGEDLNAIAFDVADMLFSTTGSWSSSGASGQDEDVGRFAGSFGSSTSGNASLDLDLTALGIESGEDVDGLTFIP